MLKVSFWTETGLYRSMNQDSLLVMSDDFCECWNQDSNRFEQLTLNFPLMLMVADGMGGHESGEIASGIAVDEFRLFFKEQISPLHHAEYQLKNIASKMKTVFKKTDVQLKKKSSNQRRPMGTTVAGVLLLSRHSGFIFYAGDSRVYTGYSNQVSQITVDHNLKNTQPDKQFNPFYGKAMTNCLGGGGLNNFLDIKDLSDDVDQIFLCSDGISDVMSRYEISQLIRTDDFNQEDFLSMKSLIEERGAPDNYTSILAEYQ